MKHPRLAFLLLLAVSASACSRDGGSSRVADSDQLATRSQGNDASISKVRAAAYAMAQPEPTVDYVAAQMEGVIKARTKSQALMHYEGYRVTLTTPGDRVTQVTFNLVEAKPTIEQLSEEFGTPEHVRKGELYEHKSEVTGSTIRVLAEPVSLPTSEASLVRRITIEGARRR